MLYLGAKKSLLSSGKTLAAQIAAMFAGGEQGAWYEPSLTNGTLFQDSAGTTPVTAVGQPVGLMLDKRLGLVWGAELVTNGDNETALFTAGALTYSSTTVSRAASPSGSGFVARAASTTASSVAHQVNSSTTFVPAGKFVEISLDVYVPTGGVSNMRMFDTSDGSWFGQATVLKDQWVTLRGIRQAKVSPWWLGMGNNVADIVANGSPAFYIDNISVRELPGNPALQAATTRRPLFQSPPARIVYDGIDDALVTTFPASLGSSCTICRAVPGVGASILTGQTIDTSYSDSTSHAGLIIINRALTAAETASVMAYLNAKAGV